MVFVASLTGATAVAASQTYYVSPTGNDANPGTEAEPLRTISRASALVQAGSTVYVKAGTYGERVTISASGSSADRIRFERYGTDQVVVTKGFEVTGDYVELDGFEISPCSGIDTRKCAVTLLDADHCWVHNINVHDTTSGSGIEVDGAGSDNLIEDFTVRNVYEVGLATGPSTTRNTFLNGTVWGFGGNEAVGMLDGSYNTLDGITIRGPGGANSSNYDGDGIHPLGSHNTIRNCAIYDIHAADNPNSHCDAIQWWNAVDNLTIENCLIGSWKYDGPHNDLDCGHIMIGTEGPSTNVVIRNNVFLGGGNYIIDVNDGGGHAIDGLKFYNNTCRSNGTLRVLAMPNAAIKNNIFFTGPHGVSASPGAVLDYNLYLSGADVSSGETHYVVGDPRCVNPDVSSATNYGVDADWRLLATSPAINKGVNDANVSPTDKGGNTRVGAPDLGAYEFGGGGGGDVTPPTVSLTAPANGATVTGTISILATATDNVGVSRVEFYVDDVLIGSDTTSPYGATWNSSGVSNGAHTLKAIAFDAGGLANESAVSVSVDNPLPSGANVALAANGGQVVSYSHQFESGGYNAQASRIIDGLKQFNSDGTGWWVQNPAGTEYVTLAFAQANTIDRIDHFNDGQYGGRAATVKYSLDDVTWQTLGTFSNLSVAANSVNRDVLRFDAVNARYVRFEYVTFNDPAWLQICEVEVYGSPVASGDATPPVTTLSVSPSAANGDNGWYKSAPTITFSANETATMRAQWDATATGAWTTNPGTLTAPEGSHTLYYYSVDTTGNTETTKSRVFKVDTQIPSDPSVTGVSPTPGAWSNNQVVQIGFAGANDNASGVEGYSVSWSLNAPQLPDAVVDLPAAATSSSSPALADGMWYFSLRTKDLAGNWTSTLDLGPFKCDSTPPNDPNVKSSTHGNPAATYADNDPAFEYAATDAASGVTAYSRVLDQNPTTVPTATGGTTTTSVSYSDVADGTWYFHVRAKDAADNWGPATHFRINVDTTGPQAPSGLSATAGEAQVQLEWTNPTADFASTRVLRSEDGFASTPASTTSQTIVYEGTASRYLDRGLADRTFYYTVFARDAAGNWGNSSAASATPLAPATLVATAVSLYRSASVISYGGSVTLSGHLTTLDTPAVPLQTAAIPLQLQRRSGKTTWTTIKTGLFTDASGFYSYTSKPTYSAVYRVVWSGEGPYAPAASAITSVKVKSRTSLRARSYRLSRGATLLLYGGIAPRRSGKVLRIYSKIGRTWRLVGRARTNRYGRYWWRQRMWLRGARYFRGYAPWDTQNEASYSRYITVRVS